MQHQKLLQDAAALAEAQALDALQHQQDVSGENTALKQEIQVCAQRPSSAPLMAALCGPGR